MSMREERKCALCEKRSGRFFTVKECTGRVRLVTCEACYKEYYATEIENEKISLSERGLIILQRERNLSGSTRKLRNMAVVLGTLVLVVAITCIMSGILLDHGALERIYLFGNFTVEKLYGSFLVFGGCFIALYAVGVLMRIVMRLVFRRDE